MSTPLMRQYQQVKAKYPDTVLLFRMGDFFETFDEDAKVASRVLGITLTKRGNGAAGEVPLAGFPHHALESYLPRLLKAGYRVAVCEQLEDPKFAKGIVKRDVIEVVTPGVAFSSAVLDQKSNNYLAAVALPSAVAPADASVGLAFVDVTTGEFAAGECTLRQLPEQLTTIQPAELLVQRRDSEALKLLFRDRYSGIYTRVDDWIFTHQYGYDILVNHFKTQSLKGFGIQDLPMATVAAGAILNYLQETQKARIPHISKVVPFEVGDYMVLDSSTKKNLEITSSLSGDTQGTLFAVLDHTLTPMGSRLLRRWVHRPLRKRSSIIERQEAVKDLVESDTLRTAVRGDLLHMGDLERLMGRIATGRASPRELNQLRIFLEVVPLLVAHLEPATSKTLADLRSALDALPDVVRLVGTAVADDPPASLAEGGVIRAGYNQSLDELRTLAHSGKDWIARLQQTERERTGISSLKVGYNNVFGYYIEVTNTHRNKIPQDYIRKQTLTNAERYVTPELKEYEDRILHAEERIQALERELFEQVRATVSESSARILRNAELIASLDGYASLAEVAVQRRYVRPTITEEGRLNIRDGRHPVIETLLPPGEAFTPNDAELDVRAAQILVITGPNMSGKSSYLRQVGLIVLLAQIGSYVPAAEAEVGIVDRIYTRVGASDNIASGESTFLVEMHEAAHIANTATERSLILLDEVGRGTSTFDGISIAWALTEYLHERVRAKTLFATHYHELNELASLYPRIKNFKVDVREYADKVIFLHKVVPGFADHSYGIQVAQMAGLPQEVTNRAKDILRNLEQTELTPHKDREEAGSRGRKGSVEPPVQLTLFELQDDRIRKALKELEIDQLTPLQALEKLAELKKMLERQ